MKNDLWEVEIKSWDSDGSTAFLRKIAELGIPIRTGRVVGNSLFFLLIMHQVEDVDAILEISAIEVREVRVGKINWGDWAVPK